MINNAIKIRRAAEEDRLSVLELLNQVFIKNQRSSVQRSHDYWHWKYKDNVFGDPILTVAEINGQIVGFDNLWPWELKYRGTTLKTYQPCDSVLLPNYRGQGIFEKIRLAGISEAVNRKHHFLFNFPNKNSLPTNLRIGAHYMGKISWWVKVLQPIKFAYGMLKNDLSTAVEIDKKFKIDTEILDYISNRYLSFDNFIDINRINGFHDWRYKKRPNRQYGIVNLERSGKFIGGVFTLSQKGIIREMVIVDILGDANLYRDLFLEFVDVAKYLGASYITVMNNCKFNTDKLWRIGFLKAKAKNMVVLPIDISIENSCIDMSRWSLVAGMHDSI